ncbi:hypothetical protein AXW83_13900 [Bosea sp. PAMC 26642]|nr:hypothetical protein AXW83_13900 [Bosea sp. PAMC 26642]
MGDGLDDIGIPIRAAIRKEMAALRRAKLNSMNQREHWPESVRLKARQRREALVAAMRNGYGEEPMTAPEIDRLVRFGDRVAALMQRRR